VGCVGQNSVRLQYDSLGHCAHPVQLLDYSLIEILVGIGVAVWVVGATDLFQRSHIVGQVMHLGYPVAVLDHLALNLVLCAFAGVVQALAAKTPTILGLARVLIFLTIKPNPGAGFRIQFKTNGGDAVGVNGRLEILGEHLEGADSIHGSKVIRASLMGAERAAGRWLRLADVT